MKAPPEEHKTMAAGKATGHEKDALGFKTPLRENRSRILTNIGRDTMPRSYAAGECFVLPAAFPMDSFDLVLLEAMTSRVPMVASDIAASPEVIKHEVTRLLFNPGDENHVIEGHCQGKQR